MPTRLVVARYFFPIVLVLGTTACEKQVNDVGDFPELPREVSESLEWVDDARTELRTRMPVADPPDSEDIAPDIERQKFCTTVFTANLTYRVAHCFLDRDDLGNAGRVTDTGGDGEETLSEHVTKADLYTLTHFGGKELVQPYYCGYFGTGPWDATITQRQSCSNIHDEFELNFLAGGKHYSVIWFKELANRPPELELNNIEEASQACDCCPRFERCPIPGEDPAVFACKVRKPDGTSACDPPIHF